MNLEIYVCPFCGKDIKWENGKLLHCKLLHCKLLQGEKCITGECVYRHKERTKRD
jgi:hypothetical protein